MRGLAASGDYFHCRSKRKQKKHSGWHGRRNICTGSQAANDGTVRLGCGVLSACPASEFATRVRRFLELSRLNLYAYVEGNSVSYSDPDGLRAFAQPPRPGRAPRRQLCIRWRCTICDPAPRPLSCPATECTTFEVSAPPGQPGQGGFAGAGGFAGDAARMPECVCIREILYPF